MSLDLSSTLAAAVGGLLLLAAWTDVTSYRISNWISISVVALFAAFAVMAQLPLNDVISHLASGAAVFAVGLALFAAGKLGGGDAKLLAAVSLWVGWEALLEFMLAVSLCGAMVSLIVIALRSRLVAAIIHGKGYRPAILDPNSGAPYAVAIAGGFFFILFAPS